jgi:hypothetical protein
MEEAIQFLANHYDYSINDPVVKDAYNFVKANEKSISTEQIINILNRQFRPTYLKVGSVGAFLWGSFQNYYGGVSKSCSAFSNGSLMQDPNESCQYQIWTYDEALTSTGHTSSSRAYVYVNSDWRGFRNEDIDKLKASRVEYVSILTTENSKHEIKIPMTSIQNLPIIKEYVGEFEEKEVEEVQTSYFWLFLIFFLIILFVSGYFLKKRYMP